VYLTDYFGYRIDVINSSAPNISTFAGNGSSSYNDGKIDQNIFEGCPSAATLSSDGSRMYVAESDPFARLRVINMHSKTVSTLAGSGKSGTGDGAGSYANFFGVEGIALSPDSRILYLVESNSHLIRKIDVTSGAVSTLAGSSEGLQDGASGFAMFDTPVGIAVSSDGKTLYVSDSHNFCIRKIEASTDLVMVSSLTSCDPSTAKFDFSTGVAASPDGSSLYVTDASLRQVFKVKISNGEVALLSGNGITGYVDGASGEATFNFPYWISITLDGSVLYVVDSPSALRAIDTQSGAVSTLAWNGTDGSKAGAIGNAKFVGVYYSAVYCLPGAASPGSLPSCMVTAAAILAAGALATATATLA
jgi:sugar lactone lactonase YvrE